jgi:DNA-binding NtrC family response regulator
MKSRVLIVDDDAAIRDSLKKILWSEGYEISLADDGPSASAQMAGGPVDLVLLDLNLSDESGWDVFDRLTTQDPLVPIIIITGLPHQFPTALIAGVGALIEKPIEVPALLKIIAEQLAEPKEKVLRRLTGYLNDTQHVPPAGLHWVEQARQFPAALEAALAGAVPSGSARRPASLLAPAASHDERHVHWGINE